MIKTTVMVVSLATTGLFGVVNDFQTALPQPVEICKEDPRLTETRQALVLLGRDPKFAKDVFVTATAMNIDPLLWACNFELESEYKRNAISRKGYKSFGQTRVAFMKMGYDAADMMAAACDLEQKRKAARGNETLAWTYYKGGNNPAAQKEVVKLFALRDKIRNKLKEKV